MGASIGFGMGPLRFYKRLGGGNSSGPEAAYFVAALLIIAPLAVGPWASLEAIQGRWGVVAFVLGLSFVAASVMATFLSPWGTYFLAAWLLYLVWLAGYWTLVGSSFKWIPTPPETMDLDAFALSIAVLIGAALQGLILVLLPLAACFTVAFIVNSFLVGLIRGNPESSDLSEESPEN